MGGTGDPPVPVGDPPTGMAGRSGFLKRVVAGKHVSPSGESPDGTGQCPASALCHPKPFANTPKPYRCSKEFI